MDENYRIIRKRRIEIAVCVGLVLLVIGAFVFFYFKVVTEARISLREAKNVKLALNMLDVEYYAKDKSVYDASKRHGITEETAERISEILEKDCTIDVMSYNRKERMVTSFVYQGGHYRVLYEYKDDTDTWEVDYYFNVLKY